jgi:pilus assembly protein CpaF
MASAVHLIVQQQRLRGGPRKIISIAEITGIEGGEIKYQEIFEFKQMTVKDGKAVGYHTATGIKPMRYELIKSSGEQIEDEWFVPTPEPPESEYY